MPTDLEMDHLKMTVGYLLDSIKYLLDRQDDLAKQKHKAATAHFRRMLENQDSE